MHRFVVEIVSRGVRGQLYRVTYNGEPIVRASHDPEFAACRELAARGHTGRLEVYRVDTTAPSIRLDIEKGALLCVLETEREGPRLARWKPMTADRLPNGDRRTHGRARAADLTSGGHYPSSGQARPNSLGV